MLRVDGEQVVHIVQRVVMCRVFAIPSEAFRLVTVDLQLDVGVVCSTNVLKLDANVI